MSFYGAILLEWTVANYDPLRQNSDLCLFSTCTTLPRHFPLPWATIPFLVPIIIVTTNAKCIILFLPIIIGILLIRLHCCDCNWALQKWKLSGQISSNNCTCFWVWSSWFRVQPNFVHSFADVHFGTLPVLIGSDNQKVNQKKHIQVLQSFLGWRDLVFANRYHSASHYVP